MKLIFEKHKEGRRGFSYGPSDVAGAKPLAGKFCRATEARLPCLSELDVVRHFTNLSRLNFSVDTNFYPLGSCTMKYNPKFTERIAAFEGFSQVFPDAYPRSFFFPYCITVACTEYNRQFRIDVQ